MIRVEVSGCAVLASEAEGVAVSPLASASVPPASSSRAVGAAERAAALLRFLVKNV
jgi:hypothetical protein